MIEQYVIIDLFLSIYTLNSLSNLGQRGCWRPIPAHEYQSTTVLNDTVYFHLSALQRGKILFKL